MYKESIHDQFSKIIEENEKLEKQHYKDQQELSKNKEAMRLKNEQHEKDQEEIQKYKKEIEIFKALLRKNNIPIPKDIS